MKITFCGAAHEVTGSCHYIETNKKKILFDCGMFQGGDFNESKNEDAFLFNPKEIDAVIVSHAHLDHTGRIPKLIKEGYAGPIYGTDGTLELARLVWKDAYHIMSYDNKKFNRPILYNEQDIQKTIHLSKPIKYHETIDLGDGVTVVLRDAGHIFGSSFIELYADGKKIGFSGDIGNVHVPILKATEPIDTLFDLLICESTYGDKIHKLEKMRKQILLEYIKEGFTRGGTVFMPAFSLERTQEILYMLDELSDEDYTLPKFPIFLDSPLAIDAMPTYEKYTDYYNAIALEKYKKGDDFFDFPQLTITRSVEESKKINTIKGPKMIIAGAGMMNGGRILHHAHRYLSDPKSTLIIVGYQAQNTLGRRLHEGAKKVKVFGDSIHVKCTIKAISALSAHGDQKKLMDWIGSGNEIPKKIYFVHGEPHVATELAHRVQNTYHVETFIPEIGTVIEV